MKYDNDVVRRDLPFVKAEEFSIVFPKGRNKKSIRTLKNAQADLIEGIRIWLSFHEKVTILEISFDVVEGESTTYTAIVIYEV